VEVNALNTNPGNPDKITVSELRNDANFKKGFLFSAVIILTAKMMPFCIDAYRRLD
jgi:hypothetical protein